MMMQKGPSRISPFVIPKLMVNAASGQVSIRWGLQGPVLGGGDGLRLGGQRDRRRAQAHPGRLGRRDGHRRQRGGDHPHGPGRVRLDAGPVDPQRRPDPRQPPVRPRSRRLRPGRRGRHPDPRGRRGRPAPRGADLRRAARLRHVGRRLAHHRPRRGRPRRRPRHETLPRRRPARARRPSTTSTPTAPAPRSATWPRPAR